MAIIGYLQNILDHSLVFLHKLTGSWGLSIILLTIIIRAALYPLTLSQTRSMAKMKEIQPVLKEIQEKYKDKPEEYQKRTMEVYKKAGVNPLGGCLPLLLQLPFLWAFFRVLQNPATFHENTGFLWLDVMAPDPFYILPLLSGLTTYFQVKQTSTDASTKPMMYVMPVFITYISLQFPSGLVIYWVVSNLFSIGQQLVIQRQTSSIGGGLKPNEGS